MAHELNNPIGFLYANLDHIERYLERLRQGKGDPERNHEVLEEMIEACKEGARRTKSIVLDLRTFSRIDEQERKAVNLNEALQTTLRILAHRLKQGIEVSSDLAELPPVDCYASQMNQVFMNLLANACDAVENGGAIHLCTRSVPERASVVVEIRDTGPGIPAEQIERIFDPFFTTKDVGQGTGLGLAITHSIVERHGGTIGVRSEPGEGTTFRVEVPVSAASRSDAPLEVAV